MTTYNLFQVSAVLLTGLLAGLFYGYDCSVIKGLGALQDKEFLSAFQSINKAILNPYFFISFLGCLIVLPITTWLSFKGASPKAFYFLATATLLYFTGVFGVTAFGNVPLNNLLEHFNIQTATGEEIITMRKKFEMSWNRLHHIRTYTAMLVFLFVSITMIKKS